MKLKLISIILATLTFSLTSSCTVAKAVVTNTDKNIYSSFVQNNNLSLSNDMLEVKVTSKGDFSINSIKNDTHKKLVFGKTNAESILVNNEIVNLSCGQLGDNDSYWTTTEKVNDEIVSSFTTNNITITRTISIDKSPNSTINDAVRFDYAITNNNNEDKNISLKTMLDTHIGEFDDSPFRIPNVGIVNNTSKLISDASLIPSYWFAYDDLLEPTTNVKGSFLSDCKPDMLYFTSWSNYNSNKWLEKVDDDTENSDNVVIMYWNDKTLPSNTTKTFTYYYGIASQKPNISSNIAVSLLNGSSANINPNINRSYSPYETAITLQDLSINDLNNIDVEISIPEEFKNIISIDGPTNYKFDTIKSYSDLQQDLKFNIAQNLYYEPQNVYYNVLVKSHGSITNEIKQELTITPNIKKNIFSRLGNCPLIDVKPIPENPQDIHTTDIQSETPSNTIPAEASIKLETVEDTEDDNNIAVLYSTETENDTSIAIDSVDSNNDVNTDTTENTNNDIETASNTTNLLCKEDSIKNNTTKNDSSVSTKSNTKKQVKSSDDSSVNLFFGSAIASLVALALSKKKH